MKSHSQNHDSLLQYQKHLAGCSLEATILAAFEALNGAIWTRCGPACSHHSGEKAPESPGLSLDSIFLTSSQVLLNNIPFWIKRWQSVLEFFSTSQALQHEYATNLSSIKTFVKQLRIF